MQLECWVCTDIPSDPSELCQILGVPSEQVTRALSPKVLSFFKERNDSYHSPFLDDQRNEFLERRKKQSQGGQKGAIRKNQMSKPELHSQPKGQPEGSLYQLQSNPVTSNQITSFSVNQEETIDSGLENHTEWINAFDGVSEFADRRLTQS
jgi:uncharacterized protein YdaU (DUF1376 family)